MKTKMKTKLLGELVDKYGALCARMAKLEEQKKELEVLLTSSGLTTTEGRTFRVTVRVVPRYSVDMEAVKVVLSEAFLAKCTKTSVTMSVRCVARNEKEV